MFNILVVEDDIKLNKLFCSALRHGGFQVFSAVNGVEALTKLDAEYIDLVITDIMMPDMDGYELVGELREAGSLLPVLIITAREEFEDKQKGFNLGIDDYMVKPVDVNEMILRVNALLRRAKIANDREIVWGNSRLNYDAMVFTFNGTEIPLPQKEFNLLYKLLSYPNKIFTRQQLMDEIWGFESETDERTVDVHINRLRDKLKKCEDIQIVTVRGLGYKAVKANEK